MVEKPLEDQEKDSYLEFPSGLVTVSEQFDSAAKRIFLQETGFDPTWVKFLYSFFPNPQISNNRVLVYMGLAMAEKDSDHDTVMLDGDELLKQVRENNIIDGNTLASLAAVMMQSSAAQKYMVQDINENRELEE
jgi:ADP-ribose pyrophosphatase YjhB (NUDIX family)